MKRLENYSELEKRRMSDLAIAVLYEKEAELESGENAEIALRIAKDIREGKTGNPHAKPISAETYINGINNFAFRENRRLPLDLHMGTAHEEIPFDNIQIEANSYEILANDDNPFFDIYRLLIHPKDGLVVVVGYSKIIHTRGDGTEIRNSFDSLKTILDKEYGQVDVLHGNMGVEDAGYSYNWMNECLQGQREYGCAWGHDINAERLPIDVKYIFLEIEPLDSGSARLSISYHLHAFDHNDPIWGRSSVEETIRNSGLRLTTRQSRILGLIGAAIVAIVYFGITIPIKMACGTYHKEITEITDRHIGKDIDTYNRLAYLSTAKFARSVGLPAPSSLEDSVALLNKCRAVGYDITGRYRG